MRIARKRKVDENSEELIITTILSFKKSFVSVFVKKKQKEGGG